MKILECLAKRSLKLFANLLMSFVVTLSKDMLAPLSKVLIVFKRAKLPFQK